MKSTLLAIAAAATLLAGAASAQTAIPAAAGAMSVESSTIGDLIADDSSKAVIAKDLPQLLAYPGLDQIKGMTLRAISAYPEAQLDDAKLKMIQTDLDAVKKK